MGVFPKVQDGSSFLNLGATFGVYRVGIFSFSGVGLPFDYLWLK